LVRMNCMMGAKHNVDDIFLWFNQFNQNPLYTYNNLLSRFLVRGFANLVEQMLAGKVKVIQPVKLNLETIHNEFNSNIETQFNSYNIAGKKSGNKYNQEAYSQIFNLLGLKPSDSIPIGDTNKLAEVKQRLDTVVIYLYSIMDNNTTPDRFVSSAVDEEGKTIHTDGEIMRKLLKHRKKITTTPTKQYASTDIKRVFGLAITNKFRKAFGKEGKIKFIEEPSSIIFTGLNGSFNPNFPRIIFVNTQEQRELATSDLQRRLHALMAA